MLTTVPFRSLCTVLVISMVSPGWVYNTYGEQNMILLRVNHFSRECFVNRTNSARPVPENESHTMIECVCVGRNVTWVKQGWITFLETHDLCNNIRWILANRRSSNKMLVSNNASERDRVVQCLCSPNGPRQGEGEVVARSWGLWWPHDGPIPRAKRIHSTGSWFFQHTFD